MARKMSDDEIMDYTYNKLFGDLDRIEAGSMFSDEGKDTQGVAPNAGKAGIEGIELTVKPLMVAAAEGGREPAEEDETEEKDKLKGIGKMSPLMSQLHGER